MYRIIPETKDPVTTAQKAWIEVREIFWGHTLNSVKHFKPLSVIRLGGGTHDEMKPLGDRDVASVTIIQPTQDGRLRLNLKPGLDIELREDGESKRTADMKTGEWMTDAQGQPWIEFKPTMTSLLRLGPQMFAVRLVSPTEVPKTPWYSRIEPVMDSLLTVALLGFTIGVLYLQMLPPPEVADLLDTEAEWNDTRFTHVIAQAIELQPKPKPEPVKVALSQPKAFRPEGRIGKDDALLDNAKGTARPMISDQEVVNNSGILGSPDALAKLDMDFGGGMERLSKNLGTLTGYDGADMRGRNGMGLRGPGKGGGGDVLGLGGGLQTHGLVSKDGRIHGVGDPRKLKHDGAFAELKTDDFSSRGSMDKSVIARILKKHFSQIRYCYQRELNANPKLYGKITSHFTIDSRGMVSKSGIKISTMKNEAVEQCIARTIKRIVFPKPNGGGIVEVIYPFLFRVSSSDE
jgi:outer membrane biosynthesis protein TonB